MKILMIGLGSIGQRHLRNLRALYGKRIEILAYRSRGLKRTFSDSLQICEGVDVEKEYQVRSFYDLQEALNEKPDIAFVTNITSQHVSCALAAAKAGCHLFMEKPVSDTFQGIRELKEAVQRNNKIVFVGFQYRYHVCLQELKNYIMGGLLGNLVSVDAQMGERLDTMHGYEDYRGTYMARKDMGGGVILNQQIHEMDYIQWLFGVPESVYAVSGKNSGMDIDVEDYCSALYKIPRKGSILPVYIHADFLQTPPVRRCKVVGESGVAEVDLIKNRICLSKKSGEVIRKSFPDFGRNEMFINELRDFMECVSLNKQPDLSLDEGLVSLRMAIAAGKSGKEGRVVNLCEIGI